jgi:hypothetical protein
VSPSQPHVTIGLPLLDDLATNKAPSIEDYCRAAAEYVTHATVLGKQYIDDIAAYEAELDAAGVSDDQADEDDEPDEADALADELFPPKPKSSRSKPKKPPSKGKVAQIRLSAALGRVLLHDLRRTIAGMNAERPAKERIHAFERAYAGERNVGGGLRAVKADISEMTSDNGLTLAIEIKPVHLAIGRAIWNRFGDVRAFAVNIHLKFPFAVVGAVTTYATQERRVSGRDDKWKSTEHLIARAVSRYRKAGGRDREDQAPYLLEGTALVVFDHTTGEIHPTLPPAGYGLRWSEFIERLVEQYVLRFVEE